MENDRKSLGSEEVGTGEEGVMGRRDFLAGLGKWSKIVIGATVFGGALLHASREAEAYRAAWANRGGGGGGGAAWANRAGGGGAAWANRAGGGGAAWANRAGGGGAAWANRGAAWANRGSAWVNRY